MHRLAAISCGLDVFVLVGAEMLSRSHRPLANEPWPRRPTPTAVESPLLLELFPLDDAPALIVTSFNNEGFVPKSAGADAFSAGSAASGARLAAQRTGVARDAYAITAFSPVRARRSEYWFRPDGTRLMTRLQNSRAAYFFCLVPMTRLCTPRRHSSRDPSRNRLRRSACFFLAGPRADNSGRSRFDVPAPCPPRKRRHKHFAVTEFKDLLGMSLPYITCDIFVS